MGLTPVRLAIRCSVLSLTLTAGLIPGMAAAQTQTQPPGTEGDSATGRSNSAAGPLSPGDIAAMLDSYAAVRAQTALSLDDAHYSEFVTRLRKLQEVRRRHQQERNQIVQDLRRLAGAQAAPPYDEAAIRERLTALREQDDRAAGDLRRAYEAVDEVLDARQQARFRLFEETIERRKLDLLMRARERAARKRATKP
jgi:hypothetical protein